MNRKGFTLVELIAMLVVITILMVIAVPNISGIIKKNRESMGIEEANKLVNSAKTKINIKKAAYPTQENGCVILTMKYLDTNDDFKSGPNGGKYNKNESFVVIRKERESPGASVFVYKFYIRLVENVDSKTYVLGLIDYDTYSKQKNPDPPTVVNSDSLPMITDCTSEAEYISTINNISGGAVYCSAMTKKY